MKMCALSLFALSTVGVVGACRDKAAGVVIKGAWRTAELENLPYSGKTPNLTHVSYNVMLNSEDGVVTEGWGSFSPFFSSETFKHLSMDPTGSSDATGFSWALEGNRLTFELKDGKGTCTGELAPTGDTISIDAASCRPFAEHTSAKRATIRRLR